MRSRRLRALLGLLAALALVLALGRAQRREEAGSGARPVATFESTLNGEVVLRGGFQEGERVEAPAGGRVLVRLPRGARASVEAASEVRFVAIEPPSLELVRGRLVVRTADAPATLRHAGHVVAVGVSGAVELQSDPARLTVTAGVVTLDGQEVSGSQPLD